MDPHQPHGNHTWNIVVNYYRCPTCDFIIENRNPFSMQSNILKKDLVCPRCQHSFTVTKKTRSVMKNVLESKSLTKD